MVNNSLRNLKNRLSSLSFTTGLYVLGFCGVCYIISFAQMLLPLSVTFKGILWVIFFGAAKTAQYTALLILGKNGLDKINKYLRKRQVENN